MAFLIVGKVLDMAPGVKKDGASYIIPEEVDATIFVALGQEVLQLPRISRVEIGTDAVRLQTHKGELFFFPRLREEHCGPPGSRGAASRLARFIG